jgi:toxin ParE1/3/4
VAVEVRFSPEATADLISLYDYIADNSSEERALTFVQRVRLHCLSFAQFPHRGARRDDLRPGLRVTGFERRITIAFHVMPELIVIDRILYAGRDLQGLFQTEG